MRHIIGIDLGGTNIVAGCVAEDGSAIHGVRSVPTGAEQGPDAVVDRIISTAQESLEEARRIVPGLKPIGVGIGAPGPLDTHAGIVLLTPNLGWVNMPLRDRMMKGLNSLPRLTTTPTAPCSANGGRVRRGEAGMRSA